MYGNTDSWVLHADVYGTPEGFELFVEVPGVLLEDIELEVTPLALLIRGMKRTPCQGATIFQPELIHPLYLRSADQACFTSNSPEKLLSAFPFQCSQKETLIYDKRRGHSRNNTAACF